jgi:hypothetical protein
VDNLKAGNFRASAREAPAAGEGGSVCEICVNSLNVVLFKLNV